MRLEDIETIGIIGAGQIGRRVAVEFLAAGYRVLIYNRSPASSRAAAHAIRNGLAELSALGTIAPEAAAAAAGRLVASLDVVQAGGNAEYVVEAVADDLALKREMYRRVEEVGDPDVIIASTSCGYSVEELAARLERPERFLLTRYAATPSDTTGVGILPGARTDPQVLATTRALLGRIGKATRD